MVFTVPLYHPAGADRGMFNPRYPGNQSLDIYLPAPILPLPQIRYFLTCRG